MDEQKNYLANDVRSIVVETDEKNPVTIATIDNVLSPADGYRIRIKFEDEGECSVSLGGHGSLPKLSLERILPSRPCTTSSEC